jgi:hypothetical protein
MSLCLEIDLCVCVPTAYYVVVSCDRISYLLIVTQWMVRCVAIMCSRQVCVSVVSEITRDVTRIDET